ncbi:MAG: hypothetical protein ACRETK_12830, partial [Steroidobacteraceae bacterium]
MKRMHGSAKGFPLHDYSMAISSAVSWLGERHLLASPINRPRRLRSAESFYGQPVSWWRAGKAP